MRRATLLVLGGLGLGMGFVLAGAADVVPLALTTQRAEAGTAADTRAARVELGRRLFFDATVSRGGQFSCASCHDPEHGFSDPRVVSEDENGKSIRHSQPITDLGRHPLHWDGEFLEVRQLLTARLAPTADAAAQSVSLARTQFERESLAQREPDGSAFSTRLRSFSPAVAPYYGPVTTPSSRPAPAVTPIIARLEEDGRYDEAIQAAYGTTRPSTEILIEAMAAYMRTVTTTQSPYDRFAAGDWDALGEAAYRGKDLFHGKAACATCHTAEPGDKRARFTDDAFHNTGVAYRGLAAVTPGSGETAAPPPALPPSDIGRADKSFVPADTASFKTPSLRDIARRAPYMHDGSFATLAEIVDYYNQGGTANDHLDPAVKSLGLSKAEQADLVAFLESLTGDERAGLGKLSPTRADRLRVNVVDLRGLPLRNLEFRVEPAGDRLAGGSVDAEPVHAKTAVHGYADVVLPPFTHVQLTSDEYEFGLSRLIPDTAHEVTVIATPKSVVSVEIRFEEERQYLPHKVTLEPVDLVEGVGFGEISFRKVRATGPQKALYVATAVAVKGRYIAVLSSPTWKAVGNDRVVLVNADFSGGRSETIDLRGVTLSPRPALRSLSVPGTILSDADAPTEQAAK